MKSICALCLIALFTPSLFAEHFYKKKPPSSSASNPSVTPSSEGAGTRPRVSKSTSLLPYDCPQSAKDWATELADIAEKSSRVNPKGGRYTTAGGLKDTKKFFSPDTVEHLKTFPNPSDGDRLFFFEGGVNVSVKGKTWKLSESPWYTDQYPNGKDVKARRLVLRDDPPPFASKQPSKVYEFPLTAVFRNGKIDFAKLGEFTDEAESNAKKEVSDPANIKNYDLPKKEKIGYIGLVPSTRPGQDVVVDGIRRDIEMLPRFLSCPEMGYHFYGLGPGSIPQIADSAKEIVRGLVKDYQLNDVNTIYLNAASHGNEDGIHFPLPGGGSTVLSPQDLIEIFDEFKTTKFVIDTVACHAGGLAEAMKKYKDNSGIKNRIVSFLQTKGTSLNQEGRIEGTGNPPKIVSSYNTILKIGALKKGKAYGPAALEADALAKWLTPGDADTYVSTADGGVGTKSLR